MATLVVLAGRMIPTEEILKVSSRYLDWFRFYEFFFVKNPTNCPIIGILPYCRNIIPGRWAKLSLSANVDVFGIGVYLFSHK